MDVDRVDSIEHILRTPTLLVSIGQLGDGDRDIQARQVLLCEDDLLCQLGMWQNVVEERL